MKRLAQLRAQGYQLSLDDFATGYSSLSSVRVSPVNQRKIGRTFITDASHGGRDSAIARSITALGREFGLDVVAEGVEALAQASLLVEHGCNQRQGHPFARPMPVEARDALLATGSVAPHAAAPSAVDGAAF